MSLKFEDLIAMNALYRPGPIDEIPNYIKNKKNANVKYDTELLKPILGETYSVIVYQEQVMQIFCELANYTLGKADIVRRAMSKKHEDEILAEREIFIKGCIDRKICDTPEESKRVAEDLFEKMLKFAKYAFNKSHAACYALTSFKTAALKYYYPGEYFASILDHTDKLEKINGIIEDAKDFKVSVSTPDINKSNAKCIVVGERETPTIILGFNMIKGLKTDDVKHILLTRKKDGPFRSFKDFINRCTSIEDATIKNLIDIGAFRSLGYSNIDLDYDASEEEFTPVKELLALRKTMKDKKKKLVALKNTKPLVESYKGNNINEFKEILTENNIAISNIITNNKIPTVDSIQKKIQNAENSVNALLAEMNDVEIYHLESSKEDDYEALMKEKELIGAFITNHPIEYYNVVDKPIENVELNTEYISGIITNLEYKKTKTGKSMVMFDLEDKTDSIRVLCFEKFINKNEILLKKNNAIRLNVLIKEDQNDNDNSDEVATTTYVAFAQNAEPLKKKSSHLLFHVDSLYSKEWPETYAKLKEFEDENGYEVHVIDDKTNKAYLLDIKVSAEAKTIGAVDKYSRD